MGVVTVANGCQDCRGCGRSGFDRDSLQKALSSSTPVPTDRIQHAADRQTHAAIWVTQYTGQNICPHGCDGAPQVSKMQATRAFKNGNSQAIRIPADLAYERTDIDLEIERQGDEIRIRPARRLLSGVLSKFAAFSNDFMKDGRENQEQSERDAI
jgi:antitoxin VapB